VASQGIKGVEKEKMRNAIIKMAIFAKLKSKDTERVRSLVTGGSSSKV
jgi:hypothetical protein